jgi:hypothetical protein
MSYIAEIISIHLDCIMQWLQFVLLPSYKKNHHTKKLFQITMHKLTPPTHVLTSLETSIFLANISIIRYAAQMYWIARSN